MYRKILFFLLLTSACFAQPAPLGIQDEGGTVSRPVNIIDCVGAGLTCTQDTQTGTITVDGTVITECSIGDDYCWTYVGNILRLYVNGEYQTQFPEVGVTEFVSINTGSDVLLIDVSNKLLIAQ